MEAALGSEMQERSLPMGKLIWTASLLVLTTWTLNSLGTDLLLNVVRRRELTSYWPSLLVRQGLLIAMSLLVTELAVVLYFYRPLRSLFTLPAENSPGRPIRSKFVIGVAGGVCAFLVSIPILLSAGHAHVPVHIIAPELLSYSALPSVILQTGLLLVVVPAISELVFRGIVFRSLLAASSLWPAVIGSSLLFAYVWPVPTTAVAIVLGVASALVFWKTRALVSSIIANATLTILTGAFLVLHDLHLF
jgi:membrane protease YdiL (CAAX protease family)